MERDFKDQATGEKATDFIDIVAWRSTAELAEKYFYKGRMAVVEGRLHIRDWTDKDGNNRKAAEVVAEHMYFADSKPKDSGAAASGHGGGHTTPPVSGEFRDMPDDPDDGELPF